MSDFAKEIISVAVEDELKSAYLDYAMSVIVGRALPDVRDGLKPVHRRVLYAMHELNNDYNKPYKKSARIVGDVIGKYHPHGDSAVYDTIVRMAQPFSLRYMLVDGQGNFGSVDGDAPAAMRYTEIRLSKIAHEVLNDLDKDTVNFLPNYDGTEYMPEVLPSGVPNLLINGSAGIAVGMATNIPPHNLSETINAVIAILDNPDLTFEELLEHIPGPDFPTAGIINGRAGIIEAYRTGRGRILVRARATIEEIDKSSKREAIIIHELPYQVNKAKLQEKIAELVKLKKIEGISAIRDESDKRGMRVVIELKRGENAEVILNNLYNQTQLQVVFGINMVALDHGQPKLFALREVLDAFIAHRKDVVIRRTKFDLNKARARAHILEGLSVALVNIDEVVALIKAAKNAQEARVNLMARRWLAGDMQSLLERALDSSSTSEFCLQADGFYKLSEEQAQAILDMRLHRLTGLEQDKIGDEYKSLLEKIADLLDILGSSARLITVIKDELLLIKQQFGDERRTEIVASQEDFTIEDLISEEDMVVTLSQQGYAKLQPLTEYETQHRGGKGKSSTKMKEEDFVKHLVVANTHDTLLCFSDMGKLYWIKTYRLPHGSRASRGKPIVNLLPLDQNENISAILPVREFDANRYVFMATAKGITKKVSLDKFSRPRPSGLIAVDLVDDDHLIGVEITSGNQDIMLFSDAGKAIRFNENQVRAMGRTARGVRGIKLAADQKLVGLIVVANDDPILTVTANGYGKRTTIEEYSVINRAGQGVMSIKVNERNGKVIGALQVDDEDELMLISASGLLIRTRVNEISLIGRNTQGVRLINLTDREELIAVQKV
ncbi:MAG: DNA gyrase subunit A [Gammaproteobacteria bacterium]|nr:DNA gyrase subunit A [Gammaproteobacteria bacterium]